MQSMYRYNQTCCCKSQYSSSMHSTADDSFKYLDSLYSMWCPFVGFSDEPEMKLQTKLQSLKWLKFFNPLQDTPANIPKYSKFVKLTGPRIVKKVSLFVGGPICSGSFKTHHNGTYTGFPFLPLWMDWKNQKHGLARWEHERLLRCFIISLISWCQLFFFFF